MSDPAQSIEVRQPQRLAAVDSILGTGDIRLMVEQAKQNVNVAIDIARDRGFVTDFDVKDKNGNVVGQRAFFHLATWQLMGQSWGITAYTDGLPTEIKPGVWQAAAVAASVQDGRVIGRAVALCARIEPGRKYKSDHDLSATAQSRAQRNALRSCLGAILIAAGYDFADPEGPATHPQIGMLHQLERDLGWSHPEGHAQAGVVSYKELTREQAAELIDAWTAMQNTQGSSPEASGPDEAEAAWGRGPSPSGPLIVADRMLWDHGVPEAKIEKLLEPATEAQLKKLAVLAGKLRWDDDERHRQAQVASFTELNKGEASFLIDAWESYETSGAGKQPGEAQPASDDLEAIRDHALSLFPGEKALLAAAKSRGSNATTVAEISAQVLHDLIRLRTS